MDGTILADRYLLTEEIGAGGMGTVYRATDLRTGGPVAVKVPHPFLARDPVFRERLRREARIAAALTSPRVVRVVDLDEHEGVPYLVMEFVAGETLSERLRRAGPLPAPEALAVAREIARALEAAHALGIVHRDLTPRNVKLVDGQLKVLDFGIAQAAGMMEITPPGGFAGTPAYSAPERVSGVATGDDPRSDLYSVGAVLHALLTGSPPPAGGAAPATLDGLPPPVARVLARSLAAAPADRYGSAAELSAALGDALAVAAPGAPGGSGGTAVGAPAPPGVAAGERAGRSPLVTTATTTADLVGESGPPDNLPAALTSFVGRDVEVGELVRLLRGPSGAGAGAGAGTVVGPGAGAGPQSAGTRARLVTLVGAGGAGKSRLALQVAARLAAREGAVPDGAWLVSLASLTDGRLVSEAVAGALGVRAAPGRSALDAVSDWLRPRLALLILDNCEHLVDACAAFAQAALVAAPGLRIVATSREPLGVPGEVLWRLPPLPVPDLLALPPPERLTDFAAVRLFVERARAVNASFALTAENAPAVTRVCQRLDGIPLAIELAAARARVLAVEQIATRLDDRFRLLTAGSRTAPPQQQTLRASMDWSYDLLGEPERALFRRLAVFAGSWTLQAAEAVGAAEPDAPDAPDDADADPLDPADVLDLLSQLVDKSLVVATEGEDGETRYRLPETVREYAAERLAERGERTTATRRHVAHFVSLVETAAAALNGREQRVWLDRLEQEHDNVRAALRVALEGGDVPAALRLAAGMWKFWAVRGHYAEGHRWLESALGAATALPPGADGRRLLARANSAAGHLARARRDYAAARATQKAALAIWQELDDRQGIAAALGNLGGLASDQGDDGAARPLYEASLALRRELGDAAGIALMQTSLGGLAYHQRDLAAARAAYEDALARYEEIGDAGGVALLHNSLAHVLRAAGQPAGAAEHAREGLAQFRALGDRWGISLGLGLMGRLALDAGDPAVAEVHLAECVTILRALDDRWNLAVALLSRARAAQRMGELARAAECNREGIELALAGRLQRHVAAGLEATASLTPLGSDSPAAATLLGAATAIRERTGSAVLPVDQPEHGALLDRLREHLGAATFDAAFATGRDLTMEGAAAAAFSLLDGLRRAPD